MMIEVHVKEWQTRSPENCPSLRGRFLDGEKATNELAQALTKSDSLRVTELRTGIQIQARSYVGRVSIGDLDVTIIPKISNSSLLRLLSYAYGFRRLSFYSSTLIPLHALGFEDLLIHQLICESHELITRGLRKSYLPRNEWLSTPRGRIDVSHLARDGGIKMAALPCRHYPYSENTLVNRGLLAGLSFAASIATDVQLQREARKLAGLLEEQVARVKLSFSLVEKVERRLNRLTAAYRPAIELIRLLLESKGVSLRGSRKPLPGFLFDMNRFFQAIISRFLRENLPDYGVRDEAGLRSMIRYNSAFNPQRRKAPTPRPDFLVYKNRKAISLLDAKYRDLWKTKLPREMLYQLIVYSLSQTIYPQASIIFPTDNLSATESRIDVFDPVEGSQIGQVCLRPVNLQQLEHLVSSQSKAEIAERQRLAMRLAFGFDSI